MAPAARSTLVARAEPPVRTGTTAVQSAWTVPSPDAAARRTAAERTARRAVPAPKRRGMPRCPRQVLRSARTAAGEELAPIAVESKQAAESAWEALAAALV
ncbi:MAG: hypothetical protein ABIP93_02790 [Gemmatimonadaceae bacterium]